MDGSSIEHWQGAEMGKANRVILILIIMIGLSLQSSSANEQSTIRLEPGDDGANLAVVSLEEGSLFFRAGIRAGDRITEVDFEPVSGLSPARAVMAVEIASLPGSSSILTLEGMDGKRLVRVSAPSPNPLAKSFFAAEKGILNAWTISLEGWDSFITAACGFALGHVGQQQFFRELRSSRKSFLESRNRLLAIEIPSNLPPAVKEALTLSKSRLADANTLRYFATKILYRSMLSGETIRAEGETQPQGYLAAWLTQNIKSRLVSETGVPGLERAWGYLRTLYLQASAPPEEGEPLPEKLVKEANMAFSEAKDRIERISDLGVLVEETLSYTAAAEHAAAVLLGRMLLRYSEIEKKANIASGQGFGHLLRARTMVLSR
jgi:hypothetical protein